MTSPRRDPPQQLRQPLLSLEEFGHLVSSAFENQNISLSFPDDAPPSSPSLISPTSQSIRDATQPGQPPNPRPLRGARSFRWLGSRSNTTSTPVSPTMEYDQDFFDTDESSADRRRGWVSKMTVLGALKTKKSLERVAARRTQTISQSLPSPDSPTLTRPAPYFYAQSHFSTDSVPVGPHESPSADSVDSAEIKSWKRRALPKKSKSSRTLRELFKFGTSSKSESRESVPPPPPTPLDSFQFLNSDPFAATASSPVNITRRSSDSDGHGADSVKSSRFHYVSPDLTSSSQGSDAETVFDESLEQSPHTPNTTFLPSPKSSISAHNPSPIFTNLSHYQSFTSSAGVSDDTPATEPSSPIEPIYSVGSVTPVRLGVLTRKSRSSSSPSFSPPDSRLQSFYTAFSSVNHSRDTLSTAPPEGNSIPEERKFFFPLASPPNARHHRIQSKDRASGSKPAASIPDMWASGSVNNHVLEESSPISSGRLGTLGSSENTPPGEAKESSNEGSFETAYTRPTAESRRRSYSFDSSLRRDFTNSTSNGTIKQSPNGKSSTTGADPFADSANPIEWPLPPKLTVLVDCQTGSKVRNVSPIQEYFSHNSPPLVPASRHSIRFGSFGSSSSPASPTFLIGGNLPPISSGLGNEITSPVLPPSVTQKPLPRRPDSESSHGHSSFESTRTNQLSVAKFPILDLVELFLCKVKLTTLKPSDVPTIFFIGAGEDEEVSLVASELGSILQFCERFQDAVVRSDGEEVPGAFVEQHSIRVSLLHTGTKHVLRLSLNDNMVDSLDHKYLMKKTLSAPTTLGDVARESRLSLPASSTVAL